MKEPYYSDNMVTIYHGDCLDILPGLGRFDLLLTDPPYGIGHHGGRARTRGKKEPNHEKISEWDASPAPQSLVDNAIAKCDNAIVWGGNYYSLPPSKGWIYWRKLMGGDFADGELAWTNLDRAVREYTLCPKGREKFHPTQKPEPVMEFCLSFAKAKPTWTVLDPFMGSGTTLAVCRREGIRSVGIDREEKYCEIAAKRVAQRSLFETPD
jgi:site-specific DNA-methyltransferase (adenine-specific)